MKKRWTRAVPIIRPDNIMSSKARETGDRCFIPAYEKDAHVNMNFLMTNEYYRLWFNERNFYAAENYTMMAMMKSASKIRRRYVQRMMPSTGRNQKYLPIICIQKFQDAKSAIDNGRTEEERGKVSLKVQKTCRGPVECQKYKPECTKKKDKNSEGNQKSDDDSAKAKTQLKNKNGKDAQKNTITCFCMYPAK